VNTIGNAQVILVVRPSDGWTEGHPFGDTWLLIKPAAVVERP